MYDDAQHHTLAAERAGSAATAVADAAQAQQVGFDDGHEGTPATLPRPFAVQPWRQNRLLALLPQAAWQRLHPQLELVALPLGATLQNAGAAPLSAWFPTTGIVSLQCANQDGSCAEIAAIGHEGMLGVGVFMSGQAGSNRAVVRGEGHAYRIDAQWLKEEFDRGEAAARLLLRYTQSLMMQMAQTAVCNRHHSLEQQLCGWLLGSLDRSPRSELAMTHELIAGALGVRREGITQAAGRLRKRGWIECRRGHIDVIDRRGLEGQVCECYSLVKTETERLLEEAPSPVA